MRSGHVQNKGSTYTFHCQVRLHHTQCLPTNIYIYNIVHLIKSTFLCLFCLHFSILYFAQRRGQRQYKLFFPSGNLTYPCSFVSKISQRKSIGCFVDDCSCRENVMLIVNVPLCYEVDFFQNSMQLFIFICKDHQRSLVL